LPVNKILKSGKLEALGALIWLAVQQDEEEQKVIKSPESKLPQYSSHSVLH
jgi:hypothetical protein